MGGIFNIDGPFYRIGNMLADVMILGFMWIILSIPIFTMGAATSAVFYVTTRRISNREGYIMRDLWSSFKNNFKQATLVWLTILFVAIVLVTNIMNINLIGNMRTYILPFQIVFMAELFMISMYIFPLIARFDMKYKELFKTAFFLANKHLLTTILCALTAVAVVLAILMYEIFILIAMGVYAFAASYLLIRVFRKYRPDMDKDEPVKDEEWTLE